MAFESVSDSSFARKAESNSYPHSLSRWETAHPLLILKPKSSSCSVSPKKDQNWFLSFFLLGLPESSSLPGTRRAVYLQSLISFSQKMWRRFCPLLVLSKLRYKEVKYLEKFGVKFSANTKQVLSGRGDSPSVVFFWFRFFLR